MEDDARTGHSAKRICLRPPASSPHLYRVDPTLQMQRGAAPASSSSGDDGSGLMSAFSSQFMGAPMEHGGDQFSLSPSQCTGAPAPVQSGDPMSMLSSEFMREAWSMDDAYLKSVFSSQFSPDAGAPAYGVGYVSSLFPSQFLDAAAAASGTASVHDGGLTSMFSSELMGAHDGDLMQFLGTAIPVYGGDSTFSFRSQLMEGAALAHGDDPMSMFSNQFREAAAAPMYGGYAMPAFPSHMGAVGGDSMPMSLTQFTRAPEPMCSGDLTVLQSQFMGAAAPVHGGVFSNQLTEAALQVPAPVYHDDPISVLWSSSKRAAPAYGGDTMSMLSSQLNGAPGSAPALNPWTREDVLLEHMLTAYPNGGTRIQQCPAVEIEQKYSNPQEDIGKILTAKAKSPSCWNDGVVSNNGKQNDDGGVSFVAVQRNVSLLPPTNLLREQQPRPPLKLPKTPQTGGKRSSNIAWTEDEQRLFLRGLKECTSGDWKRISREFVKTKTATQVASHAQKYFLRLKDRAEGRLTGKRKSIHDITLD